MRLFAPDLLANPKAAVPLREGSAELYRLIENLAIDIRDEFICNYTLHTSGETDCCSVYLTPLKVERSLTRIVIHVQIKLDAREQHSHVDC